MGKAKAGLILGIVSCVLAVISWFIFTWAALVALPLAIVGLVLSAKAGKAAKANGQKSSVATAGLVLGIVATALSGVGMACVICASCVIIGVGAAI